MKIEEQGHQPHLMRQARRTNTMTTHRDGCEGRRGATLRAGAGYSGPVVDAVPFGGAQQSGRAGAREQPDPADGGSGVAPGLGECLCGAFWTSLKCIRCGACMNTCPVYRRSGGLSYGATYSGPIGLIIDPTFNQRKYSNLPFASTLNGSCSNVCPVKINIHEQIYAWRRELVKQHEVPLVKKSMMKAAGELLSRPAAYRAAIAAADVALAHLPRFVIYNGMNA